MSTVTIPLGAWVDMLKAELSVKEAHLKIARDALTEIKDACCAHEQGFLDDVSIDEFMDLTFDRATEALKQMGGGE